MQAGRKRMKAIVYTQFGPPDVLQLKEVEKPSLKEDEVRIRIHATTVTTGDMNARGFTRKNGLCWRSRNSGF